ncbi:hypothetical protein [uncultured Victivallis sp.]|uniref:hypothetical protein n=1 Tax=uncultured Victivallis sp. TaxID=354118 RepID=UPI0025FFA40E|nr:hypothetical protein [uncultured Victivallis sp.]
MYSLNEIEKKIQLANELNLSGAALLEDTERAQQVCNGIGAEWMPSWLRWLIGFLFPTLVLAADIHDIRYYLGGSELDRKNADDEMLINGILLARNRYGKFDPRRYVVVFVMLQFYFKLRDFGSFAWNGGSENDGAY